MFQMLLLRLSDASASQIQQNVENTLESVKTEVTGTVSDDTDIFTNLDREHGAQTVCRVRANLMQDITA